MPNGEVHLPPKPSTPEYMPWEDMKVLVQRLDKLTKVMEAAPRISGAPTVSMGPSMLNIPGAPGTIEQLIYLMAELVPEVIGYSQIIPFQKSIATAYQDEQDRQVRIDGIIREVIMAFPAGCHQLVKVRLIYFPSGGSRIFVAPTIDDSFIFLDDFTAVFSPRYPVKAPGNLRVEWWNYDSLNVHSVPVIVLLTPTLVKVE